MFAQSSALARSVRSSIKPALIISSASWPGLNCVAPGGLPPRIRLEMIGRATSPEPAIAPSTHLLPVASNALANSATAAASPPDVHQCVTSTSAALTEPINAMETVAAKAATIDLYFMWYSSHFFSLRNKASSIFFALQRFSLVN